MGCVCPIGSTGPDGGPCKTCGVGTYKNATGDARCDNCSSTKTSVAGSASCFCQANYITTDVGDCLPCMNGMISRENSATCFCPNGTSLVDGNCAQIYSEGLRLSGFINIEESNSSNTSSSGLDSLLQQLTTSIAVQYNISESLVQVIFSTASRNLLQESGYQVDVIIMAQSKEDLDRVVNQTSVAPPPMIQDLQRTTLPISLNEGSIVLCAKNENSIGTACVCSAGYARSAGKCVACAPGLVKEGAGDAACNTCTGNTFSRAGALQCSPCPLSAVMRENHTSCSCNTAFVFFKDTCTPTEAVYLNVSGVLQLPLGQYRDWQLKQILVDGFSAYLNVSKDFITATVLQDDEVADDTGENVSAGNSSYRRRRLLYDRPVQYNFTVQMQIEKNDMVTYAKIENFTKNAIDAIKSIMDPNGYLIVLQEAELTPGYFTADGKPVSKCEDGQDRVLDFLKKILFCDVRTSVVEVEEKPALWWLWLVVATVLALIIVVVVVYRSQGHKATACAQPRSMQAPPSRQHAMFPAKLHFPATVSFEYHLVPGHSI
jgi:hypothetical protein